MKDETYLRELLADLDVVMEAMVLEAAASGVPPNTRSAFAHGFAAGIAEALNLHNEKCGNPACTRDHRADRMEAIEFWRKQAAKIRADAAARERASRQ